MSQAIEDIATIEWRGLTLLRVADLEGFRRERYEMFDYEPALGSCRWDAEGANAAVVYEAGLWSACWDGEWVGGLPTLQDALAMCDDRCRERAAELRRSARNLVKGLTP